MIKFQDLKKGDYVIADYDGNKKLGEVTDLNHDEKQICVDTGQEFWYDPEDLTAIILDEEQLTSNLKFQKEVNEDGTVKYKKGAFRILLSAPGNFSKFEIWYRDERRQIMNPIYVHNLQNHYYEMTKVHLNDEVFA